MNCVATITIYLGFAHLIKPLLRYKVSLNIQNGGPIIAVLLSLNLDNVLIFCPVLVKFVSIAWFVKILHLILFNINLLFPLYMAYTQPILLSLLDLYLCTFLLFFSESRSWHFNCVCVCVCVCDSKRPQTNSNVSDQTAWMQPGHRLHQAKMGLEFNTQYNYNNGVVLPLNTSRRCFQITWSHDPTRRLVWVWYWHMETCTRRDTEHEI